MVPLLTAFVQLYAKLQAYAGERLGNDSLKQAAWAVINAAGVGFGSNVTKVDIPDVLFPTNEVCPSVKWNLKSC